MEQRLATNQTVTLGELQSRLEANQVAKLEEQREIVSSTAALLNHRVDHVELEYSAMTNQVQDVKAAVLDFKVDKLKAANASLESANTSLEFANASMVKMLDESSRNAHMWYTEAENRLSQI
ncbi:MAG: hypothetical protein EOP60_18820, partial [Sphingomonadales bacterium]